MFRRRSTSTRDARSLQPGEVAEVAGLPVRLRVNVRARRIGLRLDPTRREVLLTAPHPRRLPEALRFAESRRDWIAERLAELPAPIPLEPGAVIEVAGRPCRLERAAMRICPHLKPETAEEPARLLASGEGPAFARAAERALRAEALRRLEERTAAHCSALRLTPPAIGLQDARTRWGSCRPASAVAPACIRYNWRLVLAPPAVLDYIAAHECAHLVQAGHDRRFWTLVQSLYGDPAPARAWLKAHGTKLQAIG